jgi:hypothetical protein
MRQSEGVVEIVKKCIEVKRSEVNRGEEVMFIYVNWNEGKVMEK